MRGRFVRRIAIGVGLFFLFVFVAGWLGATFGGGFHERGGEGAPWFPLFPILLIIGFVAFGRVVRRTARPIGEVMDAAGARRRGRLRRPAATVQGPGDVRDLARAFNRMAERLQAERASNVATCSPTSRTSSGRRCP